MPSGATVTLALACGIVVREADAGAVSVSLSPVSALESSGVALSPVAVRGGAAWPGPMWARR